MRATASLPSMVSVVVMGAPGMRPLPILAAHRAGNSPTGNPHGAAVKSFAASSTLKSSNFTGDPPVARCGGDRDAQSARDGVGLEPDGRDRVLAVEGEDGSAAEGSRKAAACGHPAKAVSAQVVRGLQRGARLPAVQTRLVPAQLLAQFDDIADDDEGGRLEPGFFSQRGQRGEVAGDDALGRQGAVLND